MCWKNIFFLLLSHCEHIRINVVHTKKWENDLVEAWGESIKMKWLDVFSSIIAASSVCLKQKTIVWREANDDDEFSSTRDKSFASKVFQFIIMGNFPTLAPLNRPRGRKEFIWYHSRPCWVFQDVSSAENAAGASLRLPFANYPLCFAPTHSRPGAFELESEKFISTREKGFVSGVLEEDEGRRGWGGWPWKSTVSGESQNGHQIKQLRFTQLP